MTIKINNSKDIVEKIRAKLKASDGYCPCSLIRTAETKCICKEFLEKEEPGPCNCGLYVKSNE